MTNYTTPYGRYTMFETKGGRKHIGEIDRKDVRYVIYYDGNGKGLKLIGDRANKDSAIKVLQDAIRAGIQGPVEFKWNLMQYKYKYV